MTTITEADVESAALDWLSALGWRVAHGSESCRTRRGRSETTTARRYWSDGCGTPSQS